MTADQCEELDGPRLATWATAKSWASKLEQTLADYLAQFPNEEFDENRGEPTEQSGGTLNGVASGGPPDTSSDTTIRWLTEQLKQMRLDLAEQQRIAQEQQRAAWEQRRVTQELRDTLNSRKETDALAAWGRALMQPPASRPERLPLLSPPRGGGRSGVPVPRGSSTGLTPKEEVAGWKWPVRGEFADLETSSRAVRERKEFALDDWIDLYCVGLSDSLAKGSSRTPTLRKIPTYDGKVMYWLEWMALFRTTIHDVEPSVSARAGALRATLEPSLARACLIQSATEDGYKQSLLALKRKCGNRVVMRIGFTNLLTSLEPNAKAPGGWAAYAAEVKTRLKDLADIGENDESILDKLLKRLTERDRRDRRMIQLGVRPAFCGTERFGEWLQLQFDSAVDHYAQGEREAREYLHRENSRASIKPPHGASSRSPRREKPDEAFVTQIQQGKRQGSFRKNGGASQALARPKGPCVFCSEMHGNYECPKLKEADIGQRLKMVADKKLCDRCFNSDHKAENCGFNRECGIDGCKEKHSKRLHRKVSNSNLVVDSAENYVARARRVSVTLGYLQVSVFGRLLKKFDGAH